MEFDDILREVGGYGPYQKHLLFLTLVPSLCFIPWFSMDIYFMLSTPDHWCFVPEISSSNLSLYQQKVLIREKSNPLCAMQDINYTEYLDSKTFTIVNNSGSRLCLNGWQYDKSYYDYTVASQWNLVCDDGHYVSFIFMLQNIGSIFGNPVTGYVSDRFGRKIAYTGVLCLAAVTEISSIFVQDFKIFAVLRAVNGCIFPAMFILPLVTFLEIVSPEKRSFINGVQNCCWTFGMCLLPGVAYLSRNWVNLSLVVSSTVPFLLLCWRFIPESPRWSVSRGRYDEAVIVMTSIAKKNGKKVDPSALLAKFQVLDKKRKEEKKEGLQNSASDILKVPHMRKVLIFMTICWTANYLIYYGLQMNIYNLSGNEFINFFLMSLMETPGNLLSWFFMERYGRRFTLIASFTLGGLVCFSCMIEYPYSDVVISVIGKCIAAGTYVVTYQRSSELWPTVVRCFGMSATSTIAVAISLATPYVIYLGIYKKIIPFLIIGSFCFMAGVLSAFLPETLNENLPQTINDAKDFGKNQKFFSFNRRKSQVVEGKGIQIFTLQT